MNSISIFIDINSEEDIKIINSGFNPKPDIVIFNFPSNEKQIGNNSVYMAWNDPINNCENMFNGIKMTYIDLSHFKTSSLISTKQMFKDCINLKSINLNNFETDLVEDMSSMFSGCSSLISLNL